MLEPLRRFNLSGNLEPISTSCDLRLALLCSDVVLHYMVGLNSQHFSSLTEEEHGIVSELIVSANP